MKQTYQIKTVDGLSPKITLKVTVEGFCKAIAYMLAPPLSKRKTKIEKL
jgi:hypothetical protein